MCKVPIIFDVSYEGPLNIKPGEHQYKGHSFDIKLVTSVGLLSVDMSYGLSVTQHIEYLHKQYPDNSFRVVSNLAEMQTPSVVADQQGQVNLKAMETTGKSIWANIFNKPMPVSDRKKWAKSKESDSYVYLPNCTRYAGNDAEDFNSNFLYTELMLQAYQKMCLDLGISPCIRTVKGREMKISTLTSSHSLQTTVEAERASVFVGSKLVDFDDSKYAKQYVSAIQSLENVRNESARQTVLSKVEFILAGKSSHIFNQRFILNIFQEMTESQAPLMLGVFGERTPEIVNRVADILKAMMDLGFVLQKSRAEFHQRLEDGGITDSEAICLVDIYKKVEGS